MTRRDRKKLFGIVLSLLIAIIGYYTTKQPSAKPLTQLTSIGNYQVTKIYDGDTIAVNMNGAIEKVRLIGVDTPETKDPRKPVQCFGQAASNYTTKLLTNQTVRLEADTLSTNRDRYDRLLRYVYLPDNRLVNAEIIKDGYGFAYTSFPFTKSDEFRQYEHHARDANIGLWNSCQTETDIQGVTHAAPAQ
jgi:micrococcal nuclease